MNLAIDSSSFDLPLDIFSCIVDVLASEDDVESLKACSLTCKTFHSLCMKHIFATINIGRHHPQVNDRPSPLLQFRRLLHRTPTVATYVKKLDLSIGTHDETNPSIPHILVKLSNVKAFSLSFDNSEKSWHTIPMSLKASLERFIQSSDLTFLQLKAIKNFPFASIFSSTTHLKDLDLVWAVGPSANEANLGSSQYDTISHLRSFSMGVHCWKAARQLLGQGCQNLPIFDFSTLSTLSLYLVQSNEELELMKSLLNIAKQLKVLELRVRSYSNDRLQHFRFVEHMHPSSWKTLQTLKLEFTIQSKDEDPYCGAYEELRILAAAKCPLQSIELKVEVSTDCACSTRKEVWAKLDDVVTLANFPLLRQVTIRVIIYTFDPIDMDLVNGLCDVAHSAFETPRKQPNVDFKFRISEEYV